MDLLLITLAAALVLAVFAILALLRQRDLARGERDLAQARLADADQMRSGFQALAGQVLRDSNDEFLKLAQQTFQARDAATLRAMDERRTAIDDLIGPLRKALQDTHAQLRESEKEHATLSEQLQGMTKSHRELRAETTKLSQALRQPNVRGRYGEIQLERVVELAGMRSYSDFSAQEALRDEEGRLQKPDLIVRLPNGRVIAVDAKMPLDSYMDALDATTPAERSACLERYALAVLDQVKKLSAKEYWTHFEDSPELVVMFMPGDQLVDAALERRADLIELAAQANVVIASPSTLIGLLRAVHIGWRERTLSDHAEELFRLGRELHQRAGTVLDHADRVGESLDAALKHYNRFVGSVQGRLVPTLRKFEERGACSAKEVSPPRGLEREARLLQSSEWLFEPAPRPADSLGPAPSVGEAS